MTSVWGSITRPTGQIDNLTFMHSGEGIYETYYMFNSTGNFLLYVEGENASYWTDEEYGG